MLTMYRLSWEKWGAPSGRMDSEFSASFEMNAPGMQDARAVILKHFHIKNPQINVYLAMDPIWKYFVPGTPIKCVLICFKIFEMFWVFFSENSSSISSQRFDMLWSCRLVLSSVVYSSVSSRIFFSSGGRLSGEPWWRKQMILDCRFYFYAQHNPPFYWMAGMENGFLKAEYKK